MRLISREEAEAGPPCAPQHSQDTAPCSACPCTQLPQGHRAGSSCKPGQPSEPQILLLSHTATPPALAKGPCPQSRYPQGHWCCQSQHSTGHSPPTLQGASAVSQLPGEQVTPKPNPKPKPLQDMQDEKAYGREIAPVDVKRQENKLKNAQDM